MLGNNIQKSPLGDLGVKIAHHCPMYGGRAVDYARNFVEMIYDTIVVYNDQAVCLSNGIYRLAETGDTEPGFHLIPNPASTEVEIQLINATEGICKVDLKNIIGSSILQYSFNCEDVRSKMNVSSLAPGTYTVSVIINDEVTLVQKLIIVR